MRTSFGRLERSASLVAIAALLAATPTMAQVADQDDDDSAASESAEEASEETIVVTGIRASLARAAEVKRNAEQMVDSITAQDIGAMPDRSVSEALQRVPGVALQRTNEARDPARLSAEGGAIFIRGLSWVRSEFNGRDTFSANNGRALGFEDVPADLLSRVDVFKNPSADLIEGGIGGLVNLRTRKPFDQGGQVVAFSADYNYADHRKKGFWSGNALYSNRWDTNVGEFGILLAGSINNIGNRSDAMQLGAYNARTVGGTTYYLPVSTGIRRVDWTQRRIALDGSLQWKPVETFTLTFEGIYSQAKSHDIENVVGVNASMPAPGTAGVDYTFDEDNNVIAGHIPAGTSGYGLIDLADARYGDRKTETQDLSLNAKWDVSDRLTVSADVQRVRSSLDQLSFTVFVQPRNPVTVDFDLRGNNPWVHYSTANDSHLDKSTYWWAAAMDHYDNNDANQWAYKADAEYEFLESPFLKSFRFGARATDRNAISRGTNWNWSILSRQHWGGGPAVYLDQTGSPSNPGLPAQSELFSYTNFFRGKVPDPGSFWVPAESLVSNGTENAYSYLRSTLSGGWGWAPLPEGRYATVNDQNENTLGGYGMLRFGMDEGPLGRFDGNIGVRVVRTENDAGDIRLSQPTQLNVPTVAACQAQATSRGISTSICNPLASLYSFVGGGTTVPTLGDIIPTTNEYTNVLPTLNLRYYLQDSMFLRFAAGKAMIRPTFWQMQPNVSLSLAFDSITGFPTQCNITAPTFTCENPFVGTGANPTLKPIESTQFDVSWEYYFGRGGQLSAALFYKRLKNFIFSGNETLQVTSNGQTLNFDMTTLLNGDKGTVRGFELAYQQFYDFLPQPFDGLGFGANVTYIDSKGVPNASDTPGFEPDPDLPLEGMSKWAYNLFLMYEKHRVSARLAYNWRSHYLLTTSAANINRPVWYDDYGQLDASVFYSVTDNVKVGVQGTNLLASPAYLEVGGSDRHPLYSSNVTDRRFAFVVRGQF